MKTWRGRVGRGAFTLPELIVTIVVIAILATLAWPLYGIVFRRSHQATALSNMRQVGMGFMLYAGDHDYSVPGRAAGKDANGKPVEKWPRSLQPYVQDLHVFGAPLDDTNGANYKVADINDYLNDWTNNTSFICNGYNDMGAFENKSVDIRINRIDAPGQVIMLGTPFPKKNNFYMDFEEGDPPNNKDVLNVHAFGNGSNYFFTDGSSRFLKCENNQDLTAMRREPLAGDQYTDWLWLIDKSQAASIIQ